MVNSNEVAPFTVLAFDPGITTGIALGRWEDGMLTVATRQERMTQLKFFNELEDEDPLYVVCESFEYRNKSRAGLVLYSVELIGIANLWSQLRKRRLFLQNAAQGKAYFDNPKLKSANIYQPAKGGHCNDAARHLLQWYTFNFGYQFNTKGYQAA